MDLANALALIVITDRLASSGNTLAVVRQALAAGARCVQLREKELPPSDVYPMARELRKAAHAHNALFIVNDRLDLALAVGADGVHVGPEDLPVEAVRQVTGPDFLVGYSTSEPAEAEEAARRGANYIGCGPVYATDSKADAGVAIGLEGLRAVTDAVTIPVVGIGGITVDRASHIHGAGAAGCAVIGAVATAKDVGAAVRAFLMPWKQEQVNATPRDPTPLADGPRG